MCFNYIKSKVLYKLHIFSGVQAGCLPVIVQGPKGSMVQPVPGYMGSVAIIVNYGSCSTEYRGYV